MKNDMTSNLGAEVIEQQALADDDTVTTLLPVAPISFRASSPIHRCLRGHSKGRSSQERIGWLWNTEIARSSASAILKICERHASELTAVNAVTALHRIAKSSESAEGSISVLKDHRFHAFVKELGLLI
mmetsp:Transcript_46647/g.84197  ORF Transcript_46647/g.84197 Transcript_46647/m.84197 type:complete len:129 (-) Transcript_46647:692-1078(-)